MALTIEVAKPFTWLNAFTGFSWTLTPPENAVGLVLGIADGTFTAPPEYGGLPLSQVDGTFVDLWELLDLTGASGTALVGETSFNAQVITVAWLVDDGPVVRVDFETAGYAQHSTTFTVTPDRAGCAALVVGAASSGSGVSAGEIAPYTGQTELTEGDNGPGVGATAMNMSWRGGISTPTTVGMTDDSIGTGWNGGVSAALYAPTERTILLAGIGEEAGFTGLTIAPSGPAMVYLSRRPVERAGFRGLTIRASGPRNVALVGRHLGTSEMTDVPAVDTPDVAVLRYRRSAKPAFEQLADLAAEAGIGGGAGDLASLVIDLSVSGATDVDRADAATHDLTLTGDATLTPIHSDPTAGEAIDLRMLVRQDGTGGHTLAWGGTIDWVGGTEPTMPTDPDALLTVGLLSVDDGTTWLGYVADDVTGVPATTVESETTWGITPAVGTSTDYAREDHTHGTPDAPTTSGGIGPLLLASDHSTPIVFDDILQASDGSDFLYASEP